MTMTAAWTELPDQVRAAVTRHVGPVLASCEIPGGRNNDLAAVVCTADRAVFVKGVEGVSLRMRMLRNEVTAGRLAAGVAPEVLFAEDVGEWLVVGSEYATGRRADLSPGSPDLGRVAAAVNRIADLPAPGVRPLSARWGRVDWWPRLAVEAPEVVDGLDVGELARLSALVPGLVDGDRLLHTDLHGGQFVIGDGAVRVVDWGLPGAGAPWVDAAFLVLRLVEAGWRPGEAESWARRELGFFADLGEEELSAWAVYVAGMWTHWAVVDDAPGKRHRARLARDYAAWRMAAIPSVSVGGH